MTELDHEGLYRTHCAHCHGAGAGGTAMQAYGPPNGPLEPSEIQALATWLLSGDAPK
jgi:mono/diheme cytochrome c family protein